jgi:hypothetical protein
MKITIIVREAGSSQSEWSGEFEVPSIPAVGGAMSVNRRLSTGSAAPLAPF